MKKLGICLLLCALALAARLLFPLGAETVRAVLLDDAGFSRVYEVFSADAGE